jgi:hypothetical protein
MWKNEETRLDLWGFKYFPWPGVILGVITELTVGWSGIAWIPLMILGVSHHQNYPLCEECGTVWRNFKSVCEHISYYYIVT